MPDPFARGLVALFAGPRGTVAKYSYVNLPIVVSVPVIRDRPCSEHALSIGRVITDGETILLRVSDVASPTRGDTLSIGGEVLSVIADPMLSTEGLVWKLQVSA